MGAWKIVAFLSFLLIQIFVKSQSIEVFPAYAKFYTPSKKPFVEIYYAINNTGLTYIEEKEGNSLSKATVNIVAIFSKDNKIVTYDKISVKSPEKRALDSNVVTFISQQRIEIDPGKYQLSIEIYDANNSKNQAKFKDSIDIPAYSDELFFSDIEFVERYSTSTEINNNTKNGYDIIPYIGNFFPAKVTNLKFYCEIYNSDKHFGDQNIYLIKYYIRVFETQKTLDGMVKSLKVKATSVNALLAEIPIKELPSGNYELVIEIIDRENNLIKTKIVPFYRSNPKFQYKLEDVEAIPISGLWVDNFKSIDSLLDCIYSLRPICNPSELEFIDNNFNSKSKLDFELMKKFFLRFWEARNAADPEKLWNLYYEEVKKVNKAFGTKIMKGYATDRGRIYLKYGPPNHIVKSPFDPNAVPYEIWHYYKLNNQRNKKFVFASQELATNDMELIHSDAAGEYTDKNWLSKIRDNNSFRLTGNEKVEEGGIDPVFGERFRQLFLNPY